MGEMSFADKLKSKVNKFKKQEKEKAEKTTMVVDPNRAPGFNVGDVVKIRLVPPKPVLEDKDVDFYKTMYFHSYATAQNAKRRGHFVCPKNIDWDQICSFCDFAADTYQNFGSNKDFKNYKRRRTYVFNAFIVAYENEKADDATRKIWNDVIGTIKIFHFPDTLRQVVVEEEEGVAEHDKYNPYDGYDLIIKIGSKTDGDTTYRDYSLSKFSRKKDAIAKTKKEINEILETAYDLEDYIVARIESDNDIQQKALKEGLIEAVTASESMDATKETTHEEENTKEEETSSTSKMEDDVPMTSSEEESETNTTTTDENEEKPDSSSTENDAGDDSDDDVINRLKSMFEDDD